MEKECFKCGRRKDLSCFYAHPMMADGRLNKCKDCAKKDTIENRSRNSEYYRKYDRDRSMLPYRVKARQDYASTIIGRAAVRGCQDRWSLRNPRKRAAQILFRNRLRSNPELGPFPCVKCGKKAHGHHENYDEPLKVVWLCPKHHKDRHREMKALGIEP